MELYPTVEMYAIVTLFIHDCYPDFKLNDTDVVTIRKTNNNYILCNVHIADGTNTIVRIEKCDFDLWCMARILFPRVKNL